MRSGVAALVLVLLCGLAFAVRSVGFEQTFPEGSTDLSTETAETPERMVLAVDDAQYHARRAAYTFLNFPRVLAWDPYLNHPVGAFVPWPPLYDFGLGAFARLFGSEPPVLNRVLAWASVVLSTLTALVVYAAARQVSGRRAALLAVAFFALLPASRLHSAVGDPDHHAAVCLLATLLLALYLASLRSALDVRRVWSLQAGLVIARVAMVLCWHGSILYLALGELLLLGICVARGNRELLLAQAAGCALAAAAIWPSLSLPHSELGGAWSPIELSRLQPTALAAVAAVAGAVAAVEGRRPGTASSRAAVAGGLGIAIAGLLLIFTELAAGLPWAWSYALKSEAYMAGNYESQPLWAELGAAHSLYGWAAMGLVFTPAAALVAGCRRGRTQPSWFLAGWILGLGVLSVSSLRYASDLAPAASVGLALLVDEGVAAVVRRRPDWRPAVSVVSVLLVTALLAGPLAAMAPQLRRSLAALTGTTQPVPRPTLRYSVHQFMQQVRAVTPETAGYLDPSQPPEYGILSPSVIGFAVNYSAQRPTSAGNFGPYAGRQGLVLTRRFYQARNEPQALALARRLRARYVITSDEAESTAPMMLHRLHQRDGSEGPKTPALAHFRLVTEGPPRGYPLGALTGGVPGNVVAPFKLFEVVEGAVLRVEAEPETEVVVTSPIETPAGRSFVYRTSGRTGGDGQVRIRVPYAQDGESPARPTGPYRIRAAGAVVDVSVSDDQVLRGAEIDVRLPAR